MSRANGGVVTLGGDVVGHCVYDGVSDTMRTALFPTRDEAWSTPEASYRRCNCHAPVLAAVIVWCGYGGSSAWRGVACVLCRTLIGPTAPHDEPVVYATPEQRKMAHTALGVEED